MKIGYDSEGRAVEATETQMRYMHRFRSALQLDLDESLIAHQIQMINEELNRDQKAYEDLWRLMGSKERAAIKGYLSIPVEMPVMRADGRA